MHATGVELDYTLFIGQSAQTDRIVIRVIFRTLNNPERRVERIGAILQERIGIIEIVTSVVRADDDWALAGRRGRCIFLLLYIDAGSDGGGESGSEKITAGYSHGNPANGEKDSMVASYRV